MTPTAIKSQIFNEVQETDKASPELPQRKGTLEIENLSAWYGKTQAVKNISMSIMSNRLKNEDPPLGIGGWTAADEPAPPTFGKNGFSELAGITIVS